MLQYGDDISEKDVDDEDQIEVAAKASSPTKPAQGLVGPDPTLPQGGSWPSAEPIKDAGPELADGRSGAIPEADAGAQTGPSKSYATDIPGP